MKKILKNIIVMFLLFIVTYLFLLAACWRIETINNNPNGYTDNGRAHSVKLFQ